MYILWWGGPFRDHLLSKRSEVGQISSSLHLLQLLRLLLPGVPQELAMLKDSGADNCIFEGKGWGVGGVVVAQQLGHGLDLLALLVPVWALDANRFGAVSPQTRPVAMSGILRDHIHILDQPSLPPVLWFHHVLRLQSTGTSRRRSGLPPLDSLDPELSRTTSSVLPRA